MDVRYQQEARYIFGQLKSLSKDELTNGLFTYMNDMPMLLKSKSEAKTVAEFTKIAKLTRVLAARAAFYITQTTAKMKESKLTELQKANQRYALDVERMTKCHFQLIITLMALNYIDNHTFRDPAFKPLLRLLIKISALKSIQTHTVGLYECGFFRQGMQQVMQDSMNALLVELRPHMVPLVEAFSIDSQDINVIGNKYGDIYELQLETAKRSRLNREPVLPFYEQFMKPTMAMHPAKL